MMGGMTDCGTMGPAMTWGMGLVGILLLVLLLLAIAALAKYVFGGRRSG